MKNIWAQWWIPAISHAIAFIVLVVGFPYLFHKLHLIHNLTLALIAVGAVCSLVFLAKAHHFSIKVSGLWVLLVGCLIWYTWPKEQLGNWNLQRADHLIAWFLFAFAVSAVVEGISLYRRKRKA